MIPVYIASATTSQLLTFDDPSVDTDQDTAFTAMVRTADLEGVRTGGHSRLRRVAQEVDIGTSATVKVTPVADKTEVPADSTTFSLTSTTDGQAPTVVANPATNGERFGVKVEVTAHVGETSLGACSIWGVERRQQR